MTLVPTDNQEGQSEEEQQKQKLKEKCRKEFLGALAAEGKWKVRIDHFHDMPQ